ncbi:hypothetical protein Dimus_021015, partial [Dionaea muscipula]
EVEDHLPDPPIPVFNTSDLAHPLPSDQQLPSNGLASSNESNSPSSPASSPPPISVDTSQAQIEPVPVTTMAVPSNPSSSHPMQTRAKSVVQKPNPKYALLHTYDSIPQEPQNLRVSLAHRVGIVLWKMNFHLPTSITLEHWCLDILPCM